MKNKLFEFHGSDFSFHQKLSIFILSNSKMIRLRMNTPTLWCEWKKASITSER